MRLKKIEVGGFKSFLERTKLVFQPGITAIVGPNGCGKSNVVDAVLWVLGEQSAKSLRGSAMEDVIFNGAQDREPVGMAEVDLVLDNSTGMAPPQYAQCSEIMVTRRLYRTGESEYLINKTQCRLRDILELFMDTGVGAKAYSIIKQGQIERITGAKPEDLRGFIEEAAGVAKYKARKKAAERKLESTKENLTRLNDILAEINRQLDSLNRQAKKAQRYKTYKEELRELDLSLAAHKLAELKNELGQRETSLRSSKDREAGLANEIEARENRIEAGRASLLESEKLINDLSQKHFRAQSEIQEAEKNVELMTRRIGSIVELRNRDEVEIKQITEQVEAIDGELAAMEEFRKALVMEVASNDADLGSRAKELVETKERKEVIRRSHEDSLSQLAAIKASINAIKQTTSERREQIADIEAKLAEKKISKTLLLDEIEKLKQLSFDFTQSLDDLIHAKEKLEKDLVAKTADFEALKKSYDDKETTLELLRTEFNQRLSRFDSLKELEANLEGYDDGVRAIMLQKQNREGIFGLVADILRTSPEYEKALEAVLGNRLQYVIVKSHQEGVESVDYLKTQASGRGTFIPIEVKADDSAPLPAAYHDRVLGNLIDLVDVTPDYRSVASYLLQDVVLVPNMNTAVDVWSSNGHRKTLVTLDGDVLNPAGVLTGGASLGTGVLKKKREIRELEEEVALVKNKVESAVAECREIERKIAETQKNIEEVKNGYHRHELEILHHEKELEKYKSASDGIYKNLKDVAEEETYLAREAERCARRVAELEDSYRSKEARMNDLVQLVEKGAETLIIFGSEIASREEALTTLKIAHATSKEKLDSAEKRFKELADRRDDLVETRRKKMAEIAKGAEDIRILDEDVEKLKTALSDMHTRRMSLESDLAQKRDSHQKAQTGQNADEETLKESRKNVEEVRRTLGDFYVACNEYTLKIEHLVSDIDEKYSVDLLETGTKRIEEETLLNEKLERRSQLRDLIERMGEVNLTAIKEYEELKQRFDFQEAQRQDLTKSIEDLEEVIKKINVTSRKRFAETFEEVNSHFQKLFPRMFNGGRAKLLLEGAADMSEAGVEIEVQPPGKKLQKMSLLSGGEKALTAVSLIFSLFLVKPSPFCILDEVDSPLDDVNIDRFNDLVRDLSKTSQFLIITHNKRTMELADTLYGVTMELKGVSKLVSVKLTESGKLAGQEAA